MLPARLLLVLGASWFAAFAAFGLAQHLTAASGDTLRGVVRQPYPVSKGLGATHGSPARYLGEVPEPPAETQPTMYAVQPGDTLYAIAAASKVSLATLVTLNHLDGSLIYPGQVLKLAAVQTAAPRPLVVTVTRGDTLWALAEAHHVSVAALLAANGLSSGDVLHPGDTLVLPGRYAKTDAAADVGGVAVTTLTVTRGETLSGLARRYHTSVAALIALNGLHGSAIQAGQTLRVVPTPAVASPFGRPLTPTAGRGLIWPLVGVITSPFGNRSFQVAGSRFHTGLDIDGDSGDPIEAAIGGTVIFSGWDRQGYGDLVIVHAGDADYYYAHCSKLLVEKGDAVRQGQIIARVGATGDATGSHLHFEIRVNDVPINPLPFLLKRVSAP